MGYTVIFVIINYLAKTVTYHLCSKEIDSPELARMFWKQVILTAIDQITLPEIAAMSSTVDFVTEFAPTAVSITHDQLLFYYRQMVRQSHRTKPCNCTFEYIATMCKITVFDCYH